MHAHYEVSNEIQTKVVKPKLFFGGLKIQIKSEKYIELVQRD